MLSLHKALFLGISFTVLQYHSAPSQPLELPPSHYTASGSASNMFGVNCLDTITRFGRPYSESCAEALIQMPFDGTERTFSQDLELPFHVSAAGCTVRVDLLPGSPPVQTSWLYLQTAATQLMTGCLRVYDHSAVRTGGAIIVGRARSCLQITLTKT